MRKAVKGLEKAREIKFKFFNYVCPLLEGMMPDWDYDDMHLGLSIGNDTTLEYASFKDEPFEIEENETNEGYYIRLTGEQGQDLLVQINNESKLEYVQLGADELILTTENNKYKIGYL
jgi:hypothetical protein